MRYRLDVVTGPTAEPVTAAEVRTHLRIDLESEEAFLATLIPTARREIESWLGRALLPQTWDLSLAAWPAERELVLPRPPLASVTSVVWKDEDGASHTMPTADYQVDAPANNCGAIVLAKNASWPSGTLYPRWPIVIRFIAGWAAAAYVPPEICLWIRQATGYLYENRELADLASYPRQQLINYREFYYDGTESEKAD
jgi:uncharacterized phiE125 gp8 family phage protein